MINAGTGDSVVVVVQIQRPGFDSRRYQIFWEVVVLERGPLSLVSTTEELFGRHSNGSGLESRAYGRRDPSRWPRDSLYPQKVGTTPTSSGRSVGIVRSRTKATELSYLQWRDEEWTTIETASRQKECNYTVQQDAGT
jgi:hypothetical protein